MYSTQLGRYYPASENSTDIIFDSMLGSILFSKRAFNKMQEYGQKGKDFRFLSQLMNGHPTKSMFVVVPGSFKESNQDSSSQTGNNNAAPTSNFNMQF